MTDTKLIRIHIDISDFSKKINQMEKKIQETTGWLDTVKKRFTTFSRTIFRIAGSIVRLAGTATDVSLITSILAGVQTQLTIGRLIRRALVEFAPGGNVSFGALLLVQAGLLEMEYVVNLQNQDEMRRHLDRVNAIAEMSG